MSNEVPRLVADGHELLHHSTLQDQRSGEVSTAAIPPHEHLNDLHNQLGVAGAVGVAALREYHANYRQTDLNGIAATRSDVAATLRDHVKPAFDETDVEGGGRVDAAGDFEG